ncbi:MAG: serine/threonine-protein kinase [Proteobacteria bacterium]|nr:serine/threonine-protein kinase [Pseudomonadota bacterium]
MTTFAQPSDDEDDFVTLEDTDKALPEIITQSTRYLYFKTIARGGKSIIQSCKDNHLGRVICYKSLRPEFADDRVEQTRFLREARVSARLQHPNIVPIYEVGRNSTGHYFFTMKLVHGYTLRELLDYRERYDLKQLMDVLIQVVHALEYAHAHRVMHRDIKPENILVGRYGEIQLLDWGLAKVWHADGSPVGADDDLTPVDQADASLDEPVETITGQAELQGTAAYMSPEQIRRDPQIDYRSDVYSLGVIMYEILAGQTPHQAETVREMIEQIQTVVPPRPSSITRYAIPSLLEQLTMKCIAKKPEDRIQSCTEVVRLLHEDW